MVVLHHDDERLQFLMMNSCNSWRWETTANSFRGSVVDSLMGAWHESVATRSLWPWWVFMLAVTMYVHGGHGWETPCMLPLRITVTTIYGHGRYFCRFFTGHVRIFCSLFVELIVVNQKVLLSKISTIKWTFLLANHWPWPIFWHIAWILAYLPSSRISRIKHSPRWTITSHHSLAFTRCPTIRQLTLFINHNLTIMNHHQP